MPHITLDLDPDGPMTREEEGQIAYWCEAQNKVQPWYDHCPHPLCRELARLSLQGHGR
jgi:hypothetical protein